MYRALPFALLFAAACTPPDPYYDDDIGLEAIPVDPGAMAGTFGLKMQITTVTNLPALGEVTGGGDTYLLVERTYDEATATYEQTQQVCGGKISSETSESTLPLSSWQAIPATAPLKLKIRDEDGFFQLEGHLEMWGLDEEEFDDPYDDGLPDDEVEAEDEPHKSRIVDMDDDGEPGMTISVDGSLVSGDFYFIQRKISDMEGVLRGPDQIVGLNSTSFEQIILGAASGPTRQGYPQEKHPDPKQSWTEEIRLDDGAECDAVLDAVDSGDLSKFAPFATD